METIAQSVVDGVAFDKTILCTIIDDSDKENGRYQVTDGSSNFIAYSEVKTFRNKELVYVTVPNGDFSEQKIIIGKKADLEDEPFNYARPFDNLLSCTPNIFGEFSGLAKNYKLIANSPSPTDKEISPETDKDKESLGETLNSFNGGFTRLGLRLKFQSLLTRELIKTGNYGIKLILTVFEDDVIEGNTYIYDKYDTTGKKFDDYKNDVDFYIYYETDNNYIPFEFTNETDWPDGITLYTKNVNKKVKELSFILDTKDMVGNPYAFEIPYTQEKLFDISNIDQIIKAEVVFFQDQDFTKVDGTVLPVAQTANLFASDLELYFGYDLSEIQDEFIRLYTFDSLNYQHSDNEEDNRKEIDLRWAHRTDDKVEIFTKENLESWYNDIFDNGEEFTTQYTMRLDDSETIVENRIYYKLTATDCGNGIQRYYAINSNQTGSDAFALSEEQPFYCVRDEKPQEQYFEIARFNCIDFQNSPQIKYFTYLDNNVETVDPTALRLFKAKIQQRVIQKFPASMMNSDTIFSNYNFYLFENGQKTLISILGADDFIPGKIYYYETFEDYTLEKLEDETDEQVLERLLTQIFVTGEKTDISNLFITLYSPVIKDDYYDIKLNTFQLYKPNFYKIDADKSTVPVTERFYLSYNNNFEQPTAETYEKNTYFYKSYDLKDSFEIRWYRYQLGAPAADEYCGIYWTRIPNQQGGVTTTCVDADEPAFHCTLYPDSIYNKTEQIKVIILIKQEDGSKKAFYSNTLVFENKDDVISIPTTMQEMALRLSIEDNSDGNYYLYDESNHLIDKSLSSMPRSLLVLFDKDNFQSRSQLVDAEKVVWTFPIANTMMKVDIAQTGGTYAVSPANPSYGTLTIEEFKTDGYKLYYSIEDTFSYQKGNNTITCTIVKDGETFSTTQEFSFGQSGSNGSDYTLVLDLLTSDNMITINPQHHLQAFAPYTIADYDNDEPCYRYNIDKQQLELVKDLILDETLTEQEKVEKLQDNYFKKTTYYNLQDQIYTPIVQSAEDAMEEENWDAFQIAWNQIVAEYEAKLRDLTLSNTEKQKLIAERAQQLLDTVNKYNNNFCISDNNNSTTVDFTDILDEYVTKRLEDFEQLLYYCTLLDFQKEYEEKFESINNLYNSRDQRLKALQNELDKLGNQYYYKEERTNPKETIYKPISTCAENLMNSNNAIKSFQDIKNLIFYVKANQERLLGYHTEDNINDSTIFSAINTSTPIEENAIRATLRDQSGNLVPGDYKVVWSFYTQDSLDDGESDQIKKFFELSSKETSLGDSVVLLQKEYNLDKNIDSRNNIMNTFIIVQATLEGFGDYPLTACLPIPLRKDYGVTRYQGPTQVVYSSTGFPNYYKDEINLYYNNEEGIEETYPLNGFRVKSFKNIEYTKEQEENPEFKGEKYLPTLNLGKKDAYNTTYTPVTNSNLSSDKEYYVKTAEGIYEKVNILDSDANSGHTSEAHQVSLSKLEKYNGTLYTQTTVETETTKLVFSPMSTFIQGFSTYAIQYVYKKSGSDEEILFTQPILNIQNRYFSSTINKWDGALSIDNDKNTILAKMIGAGRKDSSNRFSGVIMGDWSGNVNKNDGSNVSLASNVGLYGFNEGETSFGFTSEGIGFIGKAGRGRILLDGNESVITSSNWVMNSNNNEGSSKKHGLYMKIDDGFLIMRDSESGHYIKLDAMADPDGPDNRFKSYAANVYSPSADPLPARDGTVTNSGLTPEYPFVVYGNNKNYTAIGWNGNLLLSGTHKTYQTNNKGEITGEKDSESSGTDSTGYIYLNAAAEKYPLDINNHFAVAWNGALVISKGNISQLSGTIGSETYTGEDSKVFVISDDQRGYGNSSNPGSKQYNVNSEGKTITIKEENNYKFSNIGTDNTNLNTAKPLSGDVKSKTVNPYDYSSIQSNFHGLYANPEGDLYLSRKLIIGSNFSATADGYLRAHSAVFSDCNANTFEVRFLPWGTSALIDLNKNHALDKDTMDANYELNPERQTDPSNNQGAKIGKMGWITGSTGDDFTWNLGFQSYKNAGIVLESQTNVRINAGLDKEDPKHADRGIWINGPNEHFSVEYTFDVAATKPTTAYKRAGKKVRTRIDLTSFGIIEEVAKTQLRLGTNGGAVTGSIFDDNSGDTTTKYGTELVMRDPVAEDIAQQVGNSTGGDGEGTGGDGTGTTTSSKPVNPKGLVRIQVPGIARLTLGPDVTWGNKTGSLSPEKNNYFYLGTGANNYIRIWNRSFEGATKEDDSKDPPTTETEGETGGQGNNDSLAAADANIKGNGLFNLGDNLEIKGYTHLSAELNSGLMIGINNAKTTTESGDVTTTGVNKTIIRFVNSGDGKISAGNNLYLHSFGSAGPIVELLQSYNYSDSENPDDIKTLNEKFINIDQATNFKTNLFSFISNVKSEISMSSGKTALYKSVGLTQVVADTISLEAANSASVITMDSSQIHVTGPKFLLGTSTVEFTALPSDQTGIYARFA